MKYRLLLAPPAFAVALALGACAGPTAEDASPNAAIPTTTATSDATQQPATPSADATSEAPEATGPSFVVTIDGEKVGPNAQELDAAPGERIAISFDTDRAGELHVHSKPEQYIKFAAGTSTKTLVIKTPGTVEVEEHDSEAVVAVVTVK